MSGATGWLYLCFAHCLLLFNYHHPFRFTTSVTMHGAATSLRVVALQLQLTAMVAPRAENLVTVTYEWGAIFLLMLF